MYLMCKDTPIMWFDKYERNVVILNDELLPFFLKGRLRDTQDLTRLKDMMDNYDLVRHFFADRVLALSRHNAKQILQSINNTQRLTEEESYLLSLSCRGVSVSDSYWVRQDGETIKFKDVNIRTQSLSDITFQISMKGTPVSVQKNLLVPDISTNGMFRKAWVRESAGLYLYKSDKTDGYLNTKMELEVSNLLNHSGVEHVKYEESYKDSVLCCKSKCFTNDDISFVEADYIMNYTQAKNTAFLEYISDKYSMQFANMVVVDYVFANPDRHNSNWGFLFNTDSCEICSLAPLFDHNQAGIALKFDKETEFNELIYPPTNTTISEAVKAWACMSNLNLDHVPEPYLHRWCYVCDLK